LNIGVDVVELSFDGAWLVGRPLNIGVDVVELSFDGACDVGKPLNTGVAVDCFLSVINYHIKKCGCYPTNY